MTEEKFQEMRRTLIERLEGYREIQDEEIYYRIDSLIQEAGRNIISGFRTVIRCGESCSIQSGGSMCFRS